jgi:hypothetical protein
LEIAEISNTPHSDLLKNIRKQEVAWKKVNGGNFSLIKYKDSRGRKKPMYKLSQKESLYISSKFDDETRAKLVMRWFELEVKNSQPINGIFPIVQGDKVGYPRKEFLISIGRSGTSGAAGALKKRFPDQCLTIGRCACITAELAYWLMADMEQKKIALKLKSNQLNLAI